MNSANTVFSIEIPEESIAKFDWVEEGKITWEWLIPGKLINSYGSPVATDDYCDRTASDSSMKDEELLIEWINKGPYVERYRSKDPDPGYVIGDSYIRAFLR